MKTGILGGTFDPPHTGHLYMAESALKELGLDRILFIPCNRQPMKEHDPMAHAIDRACMTALATALHPLFITEMTEMARGGVSYTVDTLEELKKGRPSDEFYLIIGEDSLATFNGWKRSEDILEIAKLVVVPRKGVSLTETTGDKIPSHQRLGCEVMELSSTSIRKLIYEGKRIGGLVSPLVEDYISKRGLYARGNNIGF